MLKKFFSFFWMTIFFINFSFYALATTGISSPANTNRILDGARQTITFKDDMRPVLSVTPREIDLGSIKSGETVSGNFILKNISAGTMSWAVSCPEGWYSEEGQVLRSVVAGEPNNMHMELTLTEKMEIPPSENTKIPSYRTQMKLQAAGKELVCQKELKAGTYRNAIRIASPGGQRTIFIDFRIHALREIPSINLNPQRLDLGVQLPGKIISRRIELTNRGREMLSWSVVPPQRTPAEPWAEMQKERYFSFHNNAISEPGKYIVPGHLKDTMELIGNWSEIKGYPLSKGPGSIKFLFHGTGISVFLQNYPSSKGICSIYLDEALQDLPDFLSTEAGKKELVIAEGLPDGPHYLAIVIKDGSLELEGVKIFGKDIMRGPRGWITVFPNSGTTLMETDYINVKVDTSNLTPGYYGDQIKFKSNAGEEKAEIFVDVISDASPKIIDIYLYTKENDYLFTADPFSESKRLIQNGYLKEGIAFRLFAPQTPGTTGFYRWYNPLKKDHFYHYDRDGGGKKLDGYVYEGVLGNIATSKMTNTRELYRWFNPSTGKHYYSTNPKITNAVRRGYRFDGIAGYVR